MNWLLAISFALVVAAAQDAQPAARGADRIVLKSGRELIGRYIGEHEHRAVFVDDELGRLAVARTNVRGLLRAGAPADVFTPGPLSDPAGDPPRSYVRFVAPGDDKPGSLDTAVARFHEEKGDTTVFLVAAVHVAEESYYARLQDVLDACDVVLFEGVGRGTRSRGEEELARMDALVKLQLSLGNALGLSFQSDSLDYTHPFWKNADVDFTELSEEMKARGVELPTDNPLLRRLMEWVVGSIDLSRVGAEPALRRTLRRQTAAALTMADQLFTTPGLKELGKVLITWRNDAAIARFDRELGSGPSGRWIAIFYGGAHLPDLATRLAGRGFVFQGADWLKAWNVD